LEKNNTIIHLVVNNRSAETQARQHWTQGTELRLTKQNNTTQFLIRHPPLCS